MIKKLILYHGSEKIIQKPELKYGKIHNDFGQGFYCTKHLDLAKEWACTNGNSGYANVYEIDTGGLRILDLLSEKYNILHWITLLLDNRLVRISSPVQQNGVEWLKKNFLLDISEYDIIKGYRADDSYFSIARDFISNTISTYQLSLAMNLGNFGEQYVIKSEYAFKKLEYKDSVFAQNDEFFIKRCRRDKEARTNYTKLLSETGMDLLGIHLDQLIKEGVYIHDSRL